MPSNQYIPRKTTNRTRCVRALVGAAGAVGLLATVGTSTASAQDFALHLEPAAAIWLDKPQSDRFSSGLYAAVRPSFALGRVAALQVSYAFLFTPSSKDFDEDGSAHFLTAGFRIRPFATLRPITEQLGGFWADFNVGYARTDTLDRLAFDTGIGYGFQVAPSFAFGPSVRYVHIVQPNDLVGMDPNDGQLLAVGLNFSFGRPVREEPVEEPVVYEPPPECIQEECIQSPCVQQPCPDMAASTCRDSDGDGICDDIDRCPFQAGPATTYGCPIDPCSGAPLRVLVQFEHDSANMPPTRPGGTQTMDPVLDAVADAISQDPSCRVGILGHTSEEGSAEHNQALSEARARAVQQYMTARGIALDRIPARGMGETCQLVPEQSRELNRRVEFIRLDEGAPLPTQCLP